MGLLRRADWPERLAAVIEAARHQPYELGSHDCLRLACAAVQAMTDVDFWPRFSGYRTKRQALATIARIAPTLAEAVSATLGVAPSAVFSARRGDIVLYRDTAGQDHLGVCMGRSVTVLGEEGTVAVPIDDGGLLASWRIG